MKKNGNGTNGAIEKRTPTEVFRAVPLGLPNRYNDVFEEVQTDVDKLRAGKDSVEMARVISNQRRNQLKFIDSLIKYARLTRGFAAQ